MKRDNSRATRTRLDQNLTRVSSTRARARLEMLTSQVKLGSSKLDSSSSSIRNVNDSTRVQLNSNSTRIISTPNQSTLSIIKATNSKLQDGFSLQFHYSHVEPNSIWTQSDFWMRLDQIIGLLAIHLKCITQTQFKLGSHQGLHNQAHPKDQ